MSRNKKILIIVLAVLLIAAIVYFLLFRKRKTDEVLQDGVLTLDGNTSPAQTSAVESFPLNIGMQGENVKRLQMAINRIGSTLQVISGNIAVDGKFGEETKTKLLLSVPTSQSTLPMTEATFNAIIAKSNRI
jgi:hypothetical protein